MPNTVVFLLTFCNDSYAERNILRSNLFNNVYSKMGDIFFISNKANLLLPFQVNVVLVKIQ